MRSTSAAAVVARLEWSSLCARSRRGVCVLLLAFVRFGRSAWIHGQPCGDEAVGCQMHNLDSPDAVRTGPRLMEAPRAGKGRPRPRRPPRPCTMLMHPSCSSAGPRGRPRTSRTRPVGKHPQCVADQGHGTRPSGPHVLSGRPVSRWTQGRVACRVLSPRDCHPVGGFNPFRTWIASTMTRTGPHTRMSRGGARTAAMSCHRDVHRPPSGARGCARSVRPKASNRRATAGAQRATLRSTRHGAADRGFSPGSIIEFPQVAPGWGAAGAA